MTCMFAMELGARGGSGDETVAIQQNNDGLDSVKRQWLWKPGLFHSFRLTLYSFWTPFPDYNVRASAFREWRQASNSQNSENSGFFQIITATRSRNSAVSRPLPLRRNSYYSSYF